MKTTKRETLKRDSEIQVRQNVMNDVSDKEQYCDRGDSLFSSSGVCFESGVYRDVSHRDGRDRDDTYTCSSGSCFECGL